MKSNLSNSMASAVALTGTASNVWSSKTRVHNIAKKLVLVLVASLFSIYLVEILSTSFSSSFSDDAGVSLRASAAKKKGIPFDDRKPMDALLDLRRRGEKIYPWISPNFFMTGRQDLVVNGRPVLPLTTGVAETNILIGNENGYYTEYATDEYGLINPGGIWQASPKFDLVFLGDSFTVGFSVRKEESFVEKVREHYPNSINLGCIGNGPLTELATIKEYLGNKKLGSVFWVYYEQNDLNDLTAEIRDPILSKYLADDGYSQNLVSNHSAINLAITSFLEKRIQEGRTEEGTRSRNVWLDHFKLTGIRQVLRNAKKSYFSPPPPQFDLDVFSQIIRKAKSAVEKNGGKLVFVYLPEYQRYENINTTRPTSGAYLKEDVIKLIRSLNIDVLDMDKAFGRLSNPRDVFPFEVYGHYNAKGNSIVADEIKGYLSNEETRSAVVPPPNY